MKKITIIILLILSLFTNNVGVYAQVKPTEVVKKVEFEWQTRKISGNLKNAIEFKLRGLAGKDLQGFVFKIYDLDYHEGELVTANIIVKDHPSLANKSILEDGSDQSRSSLIALYKSNKWLVEVESSDKFNDLLEQLPTSKFDHNYKISRKKYLYNKHNSFSETKSYIANTQTVSYKFPWSSSEMWKLSPARSQVWHGSGCNNKCALDFLPPNPYSGSKILAGASGVVVRMCSSGTENTQNIFILDDNGNEVGNWHINRGSLKVGLNQRVFQGQEIGNTYVYTSGGTYEDRCGVLTTTHLHWMLPYKPATSNTQEITPDITIDGWRFNYPDNFARNGTDKKGPGSLFTSTNGGCFQPSQDILFVNSTCTLYQNQTELKNIVIRNNSTLTISEGVTLDLDLRNYYLRIEEGSKIIIKESAGIK